VPGPGPEPVGLERLINDDFCQSQEAELGIGIIILENLGCHMKDFALDTEVNEKLSLKPVFFFLSFLSRRALCQTWILGRSLCAMWQMGREGMLGRRAVLSASQRG
jgi:hypothetical protein